MMKKLFGKKSQEQKNDNRKMKTWGQRVHDVHEAAGKKAHETKRAAANVANNMLSATIAVTAGVVVSNTAEDIINNTIISTVAVADKVYYKYTGTGTVDVKKMLGWKTMTDSQYIEKVARGKKFKDVRPNHWCNQHAREINTGADIAGKVGGLMAGMKTAQVVYDGTKMIDSWANEEIEYVESAKADETQHI